ncbi:glycosyltransferase family 32 protein [Metabacillus indicus]|uniref:glycosyltransferase family 32 protein n=1 Tax=Metabacillus indicus TaxID=246786 RepID=UPI0039841603
MESYAARQTIHIPKLIHYCWFGKKEKPVIIKKCIQSWRKNLIGYEIMEWNEETFDVQLNSYVKEAYKAGKYAFVSDYVRVYVLYHYGGIYLDTDVEVFKPFDEKMLMHKSFWGFEQENFIATSTIGAMRENKFIKEFLDSYENKSFLKKDGSYDSLTNVAAVTNLLQSKSLLLNGKFQIIEEIGAFYPQTYFSPYDYINSRKFMTENTYTIHYFYKSWLPFRARMKSYLKVCVSKLIGGNNIARIRDVMK